MATYSFKKYPDETASNLRDLPMLASELGLATGGHTVLKNGKDHDKVFVLRLTHKNVRWITRQSQHYTWAQWLLEESLWSPQTTSQYVYALMSVPNASDFAEALGDGDIELPSGSALANKLIALANWGERNF